jgi:hypothetical protein
MESSFAKSVAHPFASFFNEPTDDADWWVGDAKMIGSIDRLEHSYYYAQLGYPLVHVGCSNIIF